MTIALFRQLISGRVLSCAPALFVTNVAEKLELATDEF